VFVEAVLCVVSVGIKRRAEEADGLMDEGK